MQNNEEVNKLYLKFGCFIQIIIIKSNKSDW